MTISSGCPLQPVINRIAVPSDAIIAVTSDIAKVLDIYVCANEPSGIKIAMQAHKDV